MNRFHERAKAESCAWIQSFEPFSREAQAKFDRCDFCILGALGYPDQDAEQLRMTYDLLHLTFVYDDWTDHVDGPTARALADSVLNALGDAPAPERTPATLEGAPSSEKACNKLGTITRDFWERLTVVMPERAYQQRTIDAFQRYLNATVQEAQERERGHIRDLEGFFQLRRCTAGTLPFWVFLLMGLDIPADVLNHPRIQEIETLATDMVIISNDMLSYSVEHARGDMHSLVGVLTRRDGLSVQDAMNWAYQKGQELMTAAQKARMELPSFGERVDRDVGRYVEGLCNWVRACDAWSFEGQRYFGERGPEIQQTRKIVLPKQS